MIFSENFLSVEIFEWKWVLIRKLGTDRDATIPQKYIRRTLTF